MIGKARFDGCRDEGEYIAVLLAARFDDAEHGLHKSASVRALRAKGQLPPDDRVSQ